MLKNIFLKMSYIKYFLPGAAFLFNEGRKAVEKKKSRFARWRPGGGRN